MQFENIGEIVNVETVLIRLSPPPCGASHNVADLYACATDPYVFRPTEVACAQLC